MTFAPATLKSLAALLVSHDVVNLGIVGDTAHQAKGTSYHLGKDDLIDGAYSAAFPRDKAGLSDAASAIDIGKFDGSYTGLRAFSKWLVARCQNGDPGTDDIREVIFSPDGKIVQRWDNYGKKLYLGGTGTGQGDDSHLYHTHVSFPRDSEFRDKTALFGRYWGDAAPPQENDMEPTRAIVQEWTASPNDAVLRRKHSRLDPVFIRLPGGMKWYSYGEFVDADGNNWRLTDYPLGSGNVAYFLRNGPGVPKDHDFIAGPILDLVKTVTQSDVDAAVAKAKAQAIADFKARIAQLS